VRVGNFRIGNENDGSGSDSEFLVFIHLKERFRIGYVDEITEELRNLGLRFLYPGVHWC